MGYNSKPSYVAIFLLSSSLAANAAASANSTQQINYQQPATAPYFPQIQFKQETCPLVSALTRDEDLLWNAPGDWKSYSESFASEVAAFVGAQWQGVNVGKIICVYVAKGKTTFPIMLERELLVPAPTGYLWGVDQHGYKDCNSSVHNVTDCPFLVEKPRNVKNIYDEIDFYKGVKDPE